MKHADYSNMVLIAIVTVVVALTSCRPDTVCHENMAVGLVCEFRHTYLDDNRQPQTGTYWDSLTVVGLGHSEPLYANSKSLSKITLPLHNQGDSTIFTLLYHERLDTLCIYQTNQQEFVSLECGSSTLHTCQRITFTKHWIDSLSVLTTDITRLNKTNIQFWVLDN